MRRLSGLPAAEIACLLLIVAGFLGLLAYYGDTLLPLIPDETTFLQPAEGLATGRGMGTPILDGLLPGIDRRTYWQPPGYFLFLALWGKTFGFQPHSARWLSRWVGALGLASLWVLARRWRMPQPWAWLCVLWTALDLTYQYAANLTRMDILNVVLVLTALLAFTVAWEGDDRWALGLAGVAMASAILTHFIAVPIALGLTIVTGHRWGRRGISVFLLPSVIGGALWAIYIAQDVGSFVAQMSAQFAFKAVFRASPFFLTPLWLSALFTQGVFDVFPTNAPPFLAFVVLCLYAAWRYRSLPRWRAALPAVAYLAASLGGEIWYVGWFAPLGYLAIAMAWQEVARVAPKGRVWLVGVGLLWACFQTAQIVRALALVPVLRAETQRYFADLAHHLPPKAVVVLHSVPDPAFFLRRHRPDLCLYELSPTPMPEKALERLRAQNPLFVGVPLWLKVHRVCGDGQLRPLKTWVFRAGVRRFRLVLVRCHP